ncbi:ABC transporter permease subunit [Bacillaceae bacterium Marseille-Q3522]|nr:ABC transporter permease subunit [Bacillaceae bacterium Marseille-Q3522]
MQSNFFLRKRVRTFVVILIVLAITYGSMLITEYDAEKGFQSFPEAIQWGFSNFYPDAASLEKLPNILGHLGDTILASIAASSSAALFALLFAVFGSKTTKINSFFSVTCRGIATLFRNIDVAAWSMILLFSFGQTSLTGFLALFFVSFGFLTRVFMETIDEVGQSSVEALTATGASYFPIVSQSVIPACLPQILSWILFMIETNIRSATLVGILTGTGIGFAFDLYYKNLNYHTASLVVLTIVITILLLEYISNYIRRLIL